MNKQEFYDKLINLYDDFNDKNIEPRFEAYNTVLGEYNNFDKLYLDLLKEHSTLKYAPSPALLYKLSRTFNDGLI